MAVLERESVLAGGEQGRHHREFHLNESPASVQFVRSRNIRRREFQLYVAIIQPHRKIPFQHFGISCGFVTGDYTVAIAVNQFEDLFGRCPHRA